MRWDPKIARGSNIKIERKNPKRAQKILAKQSNEREFYQCAQYNEGILKMRKGLA